MSDVFGDIYKNNTWKGDESVSGKGSTLKQTEAIRKVIPGLLQELQIRTLLDLPCGDFYWFKEMDLPDIVYLGADIVVDLIKENQKYNDKNHRFVVMDATKHIPPSVDLILCRDMLGHFNNVDIRKALKNFQASGSKYLLATTFPGRNANVDIETGSWRPIDLEALRYGLGPAWLLINENCTEGKGRFSDKSLGLWEL